MGTPTQNPEGRHGELRPLPKKPTQLPAVRCTAWVLCSVGTLAVVALLVIAARGGFFQPAAFRAPWYISLILMSMVAGVGIVVIVVPVLYWLQHYERRLVREYLDPIKGFACPRCHFPLAADNLSGACPECGTAFTKSRVVALWEQTYKLGDRYTRHLESTSTQRPTTPTVASPPQPPWAKPSLRDACAKIESFARARGHTAPRYAAYALDVAQASIHLGRPVPSELFAFLSWLDPEMWSRFVGRTRAARGVNGSGAASDDPIAAFAGEEVVDVIAVRAPADLRVVELPAKDGELPTWSVVYADAFHGAEVVYSTSDDRSNGRVMALMPDDSRPVWLADSLAQWLTRLAACGGVDPVLSPNGVEGIPEPLRAAYSEEFLQKNPR